jgi:hypothetical protein
MAQRKPAKKAVKRGGGSVLTAEEKAAMRELVKERKAEANKADLESEVVAKIASFKGSDRVIGKRLHALIKASAPSLRSKLWYGMPAYTKDDKVVCFFKDAAKFKSRYATFGFEETASLDDGAMWPVAFALKELTAADEAKIGALVKKAVR